MGHGLKNDVHHYITQNNTKANFSERVILTIRGQMYRFFTHKRNYHYMNILDDIVRNYNNHPHRALNGKAPSEINHSNEAVTWQQMYKWTMRTTPKTTKSNWVPSKPFKFKNGVSIKISSNKCVLQRDYQQKWTKDIFTIHSRYLRQGILLYKLVDYDEEAIQGTFYQSELQRLGRQDVFKIDQIL